MKWYGEVIESSLHSWTTQCWQWHAMPNFGSLVVIEQDHMTIYGIVHAITTGSSDPARKPIAYKKTQAELLRDYPHIFEFLMTTFSCFILGFEQNSSLYHQLAAQPAHIHSFVRPATPQELQRFFASVNYIPLLHTHLQNVMYSQELLIAFLRFQQEQDYLPSTILELFIQRYATLLGKDYQSLRLLLHRLEVLV